MIHDIDLETTAKIKGFSALIVESDDTYRVEMEKLLATIGFSCKSASRLAAALAELQKDNFDIIIVSCNLPQQDEIVAFINAIRQGSQYSKDLPIITTSTASTFTENSKRITEIGANTCIAKPFCASELLNTVEQFIEYSLKDCPVVNMPVAVGLCGDESFVVELLGDLVNNGIQQLELIKTGVANLDYETVHLYSHSMKGGAAQLAAKPFAQAAFVLEKASRAKQQQSVLYEALQVFEKRFEEVKQFVNKLRN